MRVHTLGPKTTDSYAAAAYYQQHEAPDAEIVLHDDFADLLLDLDAIAGDQLLIPAAYQNPSGTLSWREFNYSCGERAVIRHVFHLDLLPMVLVEARHPEREEAVVHPATRRLLTETISTVGLPIISAKSKPVALDQFLARKSRYTIVSEPLFREKTAAIPGAYQIIKRYPAAMVWVVYDILRPAN